MRWRCAAVVLGAACVVPAWASADSFNPISVGAHASTLGLGITLERPLLFDLSARVTTGFLSTSDQPIYGGGPWERTFHQNNVLVAADWRPYSGRWRLSGGLLFGNDHTDYVARSVNGTTYSINGTPYAISGAGTVTGRTSFPHPALYVGVGAGTGIIRGFTIAFDAGVVLRNGATTMAATGPLQSEPGFQANLQAVGAQFRIQSIQPVAGIGLVYRP